MCKFSIIIPVYNTEKYLSRCIESVLNQTYEDYELIIVNDGSTDNSKNIIKEYKEKYPNKIIQVNKKNGGLSDARNKGVKKAKGEYILFLDSDDSFQPGLLKTLSTKTKDSPDLIRFQIKEVCNDKVCMYRELPFETVKGDTAFKKIVKYHYVENACCYAYRTKFYKENRFEFEIGKYHEDYGLIPVIIMKAAKVKSIGYIGYNYMIRENSIMTSDDYEKIKKKVDDFVYLYNKNINLLDEEPLKNKDIYKSYLSNSVIIKTLELKYHDYIVYKKKLKSMHAFNNLLESDFKHKIKKILIKISPRLYFKVIK